MILAWILYSLSTATIPLSVDTAKMPNQDPVPTEIIGYPSEALCKTHIRTIDGKEQEKCIPIYRLRTPDDTLATKAKAAICN